MHPIVGDGNCMFRALAFHILGDEKSHFALRSLLVRFENLNGSTFSPRLISGVNGVNLPTFEKHIDHMLKPKSYGTHVELQAAATYYQVPIYIWTRNRQGEGYHWEVIKPLCACSEVCAPLVAENCLTFPLQHYKNSHFEIFHHDCHYDAIVSSSTGTLSESEPMMQEVLTSVDLTS